MRVAQLDDQGRSGIDAHEIADACRFAVLSYCRYVDGMRGFVDVVDSATGVSADRSTGKTELIGGAGGALSDRLACSVPESFGIAVRRRVAVCKCVAVGKCFAGSEPEPEAERESIAQPKFIAERESIAQLDSVAEPESITQPEPCGHRADSKHGHRHRNDQRQQRILSIADVRDGTGSDGLHRHRRRSLQRCRRVCGVRRIYDDQ
jgi:hypothetical protein